MGGPVKGGPKPQCLQRRPPIEIIPQVEARHPASPRREDRAIAGLSMGGGQSLAVGLEHPDVFRWVDGFSAYVGYHDLEAAFPTTRLRTAPELLWISCATSDGGFPATQRFIAWLKAKGILQKSQL